MAMNTPRSRMSLRNISLQQPPATSPAMPYRSVTATHHPGAMQQGPRSGEIEVGDTVEVPGGMDGKAKFVGEVRGKSGVFVGVELSPQWADRGKNNGDADGIQYFVVSIPNSGIFLPINRAIKRGSPTLSNGSMPPTPFMGTFPRTSPTASKSGHGYQEEDSPTPSIAARMHQPGSMRAPSPLVKPRNRQSLTRPESPMRRPQPANSPAPQTGTRNFTSIRPGQSLSATTGSRFAPSPTPARTVARTPSRVLQTKTINRAPSRAATIDEDETSQLRAQLAASEAKIAQLTQEFDQHRADFRNTLDTLELASAETEKIYEKRIDDLTHERNTLVDQASDVESVAQQLKLLEEVVQELEEGLEDARRGEAEARGEVEFLRGEVERVRAELKREKERDKSSATAPSQGSKPSEPEPQQAERNSLTTKANGVSSNAQEKIVPSTPPKTNGHARDASVQQPSKTESPRAEVKDVPEANGDPDKWCALCERDGHDSINCPYDK